MISLDPFFIALSRMNHLDAPQAVFMFLSILALLKFLLRGNRWFDLVISGLAGGLAFLSKLPGIFILPAIGWTDWKRTVIAITEPLALGWVGEPAVAALPRGERQ